MIESRTLAATFAAAVPAVPACRRSRAKRALDFKSRRDPRVTRLGRILCKFSLDEIPSLWSVLKGELSLVGPRPVRMVEVEYWKDWHWARFAAKPGLTSSWALHGKNAIRDFDAIVESDLDYIRNWSLSRDLRILLKTLSYVFSGRNY